MKAATCVEPPPTVSLSFQSTPPVKAATRKLRNTNAGGGISIHAAREGGDPIRFPPRIGGSISIHAAREGGDYRQEVHNNAQFHFNPRRP